MNCKNCDYGENTQAFGLICTCKLSEHNCDWVSEDYTCEHWQNHDNEFWGDSK